MKSTKTQDQQRRAVSVARLQLRELCTRYTETVQTLVASEPMLRGTLRWVTRGEHRYPGLIRTEEGHSVGRSVRLADVEWMEPMLDALRTFRTCQQHLKKIHTQLMSATNCLREALTVEYEPTEIAEKESRHGA